jgi:enoyl-[acyl-carrier-protein] reductase (NADH)
MATLGLLSACGSGITGEVVHVDNGYHIQGMLKVSQIENTIKALSE